MNTILASKILINKEFQASAISPEIAALNFVEIPENFDLDNSEAAELLLYNLGKEDRRNDGRLIDKYNHVAKNLGSGGWWCGTLNPDGSESKWGCFKPNNPRTGKDGKIIKYEHPLKTNTQPFFLKVDRRHWEKIAVNAGLEPPELEGLPDESIPFEFWSWAIATPELPIIITEGAKKTASLLSAGFCAVGLSGIWNGIRNPTDEVKNEKTGEHYLVPELVAIAQKGREFTFCFDNDEKAKTKAAVNRAIAKTAELLTKQTGGKSYGVMRWAEYPDLKGIDDVHAAKGEPELWRIYDERTKKKIVISKSEEQRYKEKLAIAAAILEANGDRLENYLREEPASTNGNGKVEAKTSTPLQPVSEYDPNEKPIITAKTSTPLSKSQPEHRRIYGGTKNLNYAELFEFIKEELAHRLSFDLMRREMLLDGEIFLLADELRAWFFHEYGETANESDIYKAMVFFAKQNSFDPIVEDLRRCQREAVRVPIHNLAARYFGQDPTTFDPEKATTKEEKEEILNAKRKVEIYNRCIEMWLISAVARQFETQGKDGIRSYLGCQADHTLILQGGQGRGKSTWFKHLTKIYFNDSITEIQSTNSLMALHGNWILELAEIDGITSKKDAASLKHYLTVRQDEFRAPYERKTIKHNRRSVFCGTVNPSRFLLDDENRRFWTVPVKGDIDLSLIQKERDGIWASAVDAYLAGKPWYPNEEEKAVIKAIALEFSEVDVWHEAIESWMTWHSYGNTNEILTEVFKFDLKDIGKREQMRVSKILNKLGYTEEKRIRTQGQCLRVRVKPEENPPESSKVFNLSGSSGSYGSTFTQQGSDVIQPLIQPPYEVDHIQEGNDPEKRSMIQPNLLEVGSPSNSDSEGNTEGVIQRSGKKAFFSKDSGNEKKSENSNGDRQPLPPIPDKYARAGFIFSVGEKVRRKGTPEILTIALYPDGGIDFAAKRYFCRDQNGDLLEVEQKKLEKCGV